MDPEYTHEYLEQITQTEYFYNLPNDSDVFQPFWVRCRSMVASTKNRKFIEGQCRFVLYSGIILWIIYLIST